MDGSVSRTGGTGGGKVDAAEEVAAGVGGSSESIVLTCHDRFSSKNVMRSAWIHVVSMLHEKLEDEILTSRAAFSFPSWTAASVNFLLSTSRSLCLASRRSLSSSRAGTVMMSTLASLGCTVVSR